MLTVLTRVNLSTRFPFCLISTPFHLPFFLLIATEGFGSSSTHQGPSNTHMLTQNEPQSKQGEKLQSENKPVKDASMDGASRC